MSLPACQQRVLDTIENALQKREPRLASMFAMFTRLTRGEGLPRTERLEVTPWWAWHRRWRPGRGGGSPRARRSHGWSAAMPSVLIIPALILLTVSAVFLGMSSASATCVRAISRPGVVTSQSHPTSCPRGGPRFFGHGR
jgi:hypothetical protein